MWVGLSLVRVSRQMRNSSFGVRVPTYNISNGTCSASAAVRAALVNVRIHSTFTPPYKHITLFVLIYIYIFYHVLKIQIEMEMLTIE